MCRLQALPVKSWRGIVGEDRADHEQSRAPADDRQRNPIDLAVSPARAQAQTAAVNDLLCCGLCAPGVTLSDIPTRIGQIIVGRR